MAQGATLTGVRQWTIDPSHTEVNFSTRHLMISKVRGNFSSFSGNATFDPSDIEAGSVEVEIDVASINTNDENRDNHLRSADFFDTENYPKMVFKSTDVQHTGGNSYEITGNLTVRGTTNPVTLKAEFTDVVPDPFGGNRVGVSAEGRLDRTAFGLTWNQTLETGGVLVSEHIDLSIDAQLVLS